MLCRKLRIPEAWPPNARQRASESRWRVSARIGPHQPHVCRANPDRFLGQRGACEEATSPRAVTSTQPPSRHRGGVTDSRATGHGPPKKIATFNNHTEAPEPMAGDRRPQPTPMQCQHESRGDRSSFGFCLCLVGVQGRRGLPVQRRLHWPSDSQNR
jgi:hypothetical protein